MDGSADDFKFCDNIPDLLNAIRVEDITPDTPDKRWVVLDSTSTVEAALQVFREYKLSSVPVRNPVTGDCLGFVSVLDLVGYLVFVCSEAARSTESPRPLSTISDLNLDGLLRVHDRFATEEIGKLIDFGKRDPFVPVPKGQTLYYLLSNLKTYASFAVHRVPIVEEPPLQTVGEKPRIIGIVTQTKILAYLATYIAVLGRLGETPVRAAFPHCIKQVVSIRPFHKAIDGFFLMHTRGLSAVAVVSDQGALVANLSATDLKGVSRVSFHRLFMPVVDFIKDLHRMSGKIMTPPVTVTPNTPLETVILKMACTGVHRVYIVDDANRPIGVIALCDLLAIFFQ